MGNKKNLQKRNKRNANNWRNNIKMRKNKILCSENDNLKNDGTGNNTQVDHEMQPQAHHVNNSVLDEVKNSIMVEVHNNVNTEVMPMVQYQNQTIIDSNLDELIEIDYDGNDNMDIRMIEIEDVYDVASDQFLPDESGKSQDEEILNENETIEHESENLVEIIDIDERCDENLNQTDELSNEIINDDDLSHSGENEDENVEAQNPENPSLSGHRIVDIAFLLEQATHLYGHSQECDSEMVFTKETKLGFRSIFYFHCSNCGVLHTLQSTSKNDGSMNVNKAATLGVTSIGSGFYHMQELFANLDIPSMSSGTFDKENKQIQKEWWDTAKQEALKALDEEILHAIAIRNVDSAGNALITVICDGSWGKRSYGKGYSSLSGCAVIIGHYTKKVIYFDAKNKYCNICTKSYAKCCPPNDHPCNISYVGPSSGMETEILVEGFQSCKPMGARFNRLISDGDSSAIKEIRERCTYENPDLVVEKVECLNHLFKNFYKKFCDLLINTKFRKEDRNLIKHSTGDDIGIGVRKAAEYWRESAFDNVKKLENLERDCINAPYHCFGIHDNCSQYFCQKTTSAESKTSFDKLKASGLFHEILNYCNIYFASNVRSLIADLTNNPAEEFNNVVAKYLGGKRINYSLAFSYSARVAQAVVQYNTKGHAGSVFHELHSLNPHNSCLKLENSRINHYAKNEAARKMNPRKKTVKDKTTKGYGACQLPDLPERALEVAKNIVIDNLNSNRLNRDNWKWLEARKKLLNCSYFGRVINARGPKSYKGLVDEMLYSEKEFGNTAELRHQRLYETQALKMFSLIHKDYELEKTGLFLDREFGFLAASPLRLYGPDSIVNVQCPLKAFNKTVDQALSKNLLPYFKKQNGERNINKKSSWYIEAQGQLHITGRTYVYLLVWLGAEFTFKKVAVDHSFWKNEMEGKLIFFYNEAMLKEIADSRKARKMELREYDPKTNAFF